MWIIGYDVSDERAISQGGLNYWARRHGSPIADLPALWVPASRIPALRTCSEYADLFLAYVDNLELISSPTTILSNGSMTGDLKQVVDALKADDFFLAVEFTYHNNWSTNTVERLRIVYDCVNLGIPTAYAMPRSGIGLRGISRRGDRAAESVKIEAIIGPYCEILVKKNSPVNLESISVEMRRLDPTAEIEMGEIATNLPDPKVPLFCRTMQDSFCVPCATVQLDEVVNPAPIEWKLSGCQLLPIFSLMSKCMRFMEQECRKPGVSFPEFRKRSREDERIIKLSPPPQGGRNRNKAWDEYHERNGFPNGSLAKLTYPIRRKSPKTNYSIHIPRIASIFKLNPVGERRGSLNAWVRSLERARTKRRRFRSANTSALPKSLLNRELIVTYTVSEYKRGRSGTEIWQNVNERTYSSKVVLLDMCSIRKSVKAPGRPRAMATSPKERRHMLAVDLPMTGELFFQDMETNARYKTFAEFADILIFNDGGFLGTMWWKDGHSPGRIF